MPLGGDQPGLGGDPGGQRHKRRGHIPLHLHRDVVIGIHHGREKVQVDDLLVALGVDPHRREFL